MNLSGCQDVPKASILLNPTPQLPWDPLLPSAQVRLVSRQRPWAGGLGVVGNPGKGKLVGCQKMGPCPCSPRDTWHGQEPLAHEPQLSMALGMCAWSQDPGGFPRAAHRTCSSFPLGRDAPWLPIQGLLPLGSVLFPVKSGTSPAFGRVSHGGFWALSHCQGHLKSLLLQGESSPWLALGPRFCPLAEAVGSAREFSRSPALEL